MPLSRAVAALPTAALLVAALAGCTQKASTSDAGEGRTVNVTASDTACSLSATSIPSGATTFAVKNTGDKVTEFYVQSGDKVVGEVEDIAPGLTRSLNLSLKAGTYTTLCKPGDTKSGVGEGTLKVT